MPPTASSATPAPSAATFCFSSSPASSTSSPTSALAWSATCLAASPTPGADPLPRVGMAPPVHDLGEHDAGGECGADHDERARSSPAGRLRPLAELRGGRSTDALARPAVGRRLPAQAGAHEARL